MDEDFNAETAAADKEIIASDQNNSAGSLTSPPSNGTVDNLQSHDASSGSADASIHNPANKENSPLNASPNAESSNKDSGDQLPETEPTLSILRQDHQAAAALGPFNVRDPGVDRHAGASVAGRS